MKVSFFGESLEFSVLSHRFWCTCSCVTLHFRSWVLSVRGGQPPQISLACLPSGGTLMPQAQQGLLGLQCSQQHCARGRASGREEACPSQWLCLDLASAVLPWRWDEKCWGPASRNESQGTGGEREPYVHVCTSVEWSFCLPELGAGGREEKRKWVLIWIQQALSFLIKFL